MKEQKRTYSGRRLAPTAVIAAGCMWGSMGLWVRRFNAAGLGALQILALRVTVTVIVMGIFLSIYNRKLLRVRWRDLWCFLGTGVCSIVFFGYCYNRTIVLTSLSVAAILLYTAPAMVAVMSFFLFKEALTGKKLFALLLAFGGCVLVTGVLEGGAAVSAMGILTGLGSGFGYALYSIFGRFALDKKYHPVTVTFYTFACAFAAVLILTDWSPVIAFAADGAGNLLYCLAYGIVTTVAPYLLYTTGLNYIEPGAASVMATVEPMVATLLGVLVFHEKMTFMSGLGVLLVLAALIVLGQKNEET